MTHGPPHHAADRHMADLTDDQKRTLNFANRCVDLARTELALAEAEVRRVKKALEEHVRCRAHMATQFGIDPESLE